MWEVVKVTLGVLLFLLFVGTVTVELMDPYDKVWLLCWMLALAAGAFYGLIQSDKRNEEEYRRRWK
jgi:hypothetical protein